MWQLERLRASAAVAARSSAKWSPGAHERRRGREPASTEGGHSVTVIPGTSRAFVFGKKFFFNFFLRKTEREGMRKEKEREREREREREKLHPFFSLLILPSDTTTGGEVDGDGRGPTNDLFELDLDSMSWKGPLRVRGSGTNGTPRAAAKTPLPLRLRPLARGTSRRPWGASWWSSAAPTATGSSATSPCLTSTPWSGCGPRSR